MAKIMVLGSGGWGTAMSVMLSEMGHDVTLWSRFPEEIERLIEDKENKALLPGVKLPDSLKLTDDIGKLSDMEIVVNAVPSEFTRETAKYIASYFNLNSVLVNISKGIEDKTYLRLSQVISEEIPGIKVCCMSGPSHAEEVARGIPTTNVVSSNDISLAEYIQNEFCSQTFRVYISDDVIGVELGGSLKNVIALAAGVCDGMGFGDNTKAALMTRGIVEMMRLGVALGAKADTFTGLSGIGDLIVTCTSMHSRNRRAGILIGKGLSASDAIKEIGMTVEGYKTTSAAYGLASKVGVDMPITKELYKILFEDKDPKIAMKSLMARPSRQEFEELYK